MRARLCGCLTGVTAGNPTPSTLACTARPPPGAQVRARPRGRRAGLEPARPGRGLGGCSRLRPGFGLRVSGGRAVLRSPRRARLCRGALLGPHWKQDLGCRSAWGSRGSPSIAPLRPRPLGGPALLEPDSVPGFGGLGSGCSFGPQPWCPKLSFPSSFPPFQASRIGQLGFNFLLTSLDNPATAAAQGVAIRDAT